jgi:hypothetical protein
MGSSDPLPAGFEIRFGSLNFQATGNDYLMCITNREELRARRQTGPAPGPAAPAAGAPTPASTDAAGSSAPQHRRRSGQRSRQARTERRQAARVALQCDALTGETTAAPTGEHSVSGPWFPSACAPPRRHTSRLPTPTRRRAGLVLPATTRRSGIPAPPPTTSRPTAPLASCHPPPHMGTRSGTSPAYRTQ